MHWVNKAFTLILIPVQIHIILTILASNGDDEGTMSIDDEEGDEDGENYASEMEITEASILLGKDFKKQGFCTCILVYNIKV